MTKTKFTLWVAACCLSLLFAVQTEAQVDPGTLHTGPGAGTSCATGCGQDPNLIGSGNTVDIYQNSAGAPNLSQPLLLILGIPNTSTPFASNPINGVTFINPYPGGTPVAGTSAFATAGTFGLKSGGAGGFFGSMGAGQEVYSFLTLSGSGINMSNSFTNWAGADLTINGITASSFGIYVFALSGAALGPNGLVNITFNSGSLPKGTFVVAYGNISGTAYVVPFTEAGLTAGTTSVVPEPGSMALFGTGLLILGGAIRRRWSNKQV